MPIVDLALDETTGDIADLDGDLPLATGDYAIAQTIKQRLRLFQGEWFLAEADGVPYFDEIFVKNPKLVVIDDLLKNVILSVNGVVELLRFDLVLQGGTRTLSVNFEVRTKQGIIAFNEAIGPGVTPPSPTPEGPLMSINVFVEFNNETVRTINVAPFGFNAQMCDVTVLDAINNFQTTELSVTRPDENTIRLEAGAPISKTFRVLIIHTTEI